MDELFFGGENPNSLAIEPKVDEEDKETRLQRRSRIDGFEGWLMDICSQEYGKERGEAEALNQQGLRQYLMDGLYIRELFIPKDTVIVTYLWRVERFWIIAYGDATVTSELGTERLVGPHRQVAPYGSKVAINTHEDTLWFAICRTNADSLDTVEDDVLTRNYEELTYPWDSMVEDKE